MKIIKKKLLKKNIQKLSLPPLDKVNNKLMRQRQGRQKRFTPSKPPLSNIYYNKRKVHKQTFFQIKSLKFNSIHDFMKAFSIIPLNKDFLHLSCLQVSGKLEKFRILYLKKKHKKSSLRRKIMMMKDNLLYDQNQSKICPTAVRVLSIARFHITPVVFSSYSSLSSSSSSVDPPSVLRFFLIIPFLFYPSLSSSSPESSSSSLLPVPIPPVLLEIVSFPAGLLIVPGFSLFLVCLLDELPLTEPPS